MKRLVLLVAVVATTLALAAGMALAQATTDTFTETVPVNSLAFNTCTEPAEIVLLTGDIHLLIHQTLDANGGIHVQTQSQPQGGGLLGTGQTSGTQYKAVGVSQENVYLPPGEGSETTIVSRFQLVSEGSSVNTLLEVTIHLTFNANGEPTARVLHSEIKCVG